MFEGLRDRYDQMNPREQRLLRIFAVVVVLSLVAYVVLTVHDSLSALEARNGELRDALDQLEARKADAGSKNARQAELVKQIPKEATPLATYVEKVAGEVGFQIKGSTEVAPVQKGPFRELGLKVTVYDITVDQLANFLRRVETTNNLVVSQRIFAKRSAVAKEKLDRVEVTVVTYERGKGKGKGGKGEEGGGGE